MWFFWEPRPLEWRRVRGSLGERAGKVGRGRLKRTGLGMSRLLSEACLPSSTRSHGDVLHLGKVEKAEGCGQGPSGWESCCV